MTYQELFDNWTTLDQWMLSRTESEKEEIMKEIKYSIQSHSSYEEWRGFPHNHAADRVWLSFTPK